MRGARSTAPAIRDRGAARRGEALIRASPGSCCAARGQRVGLCCAGLGSTRGGLIRLHLAQARAGRWAGGLLQCRGPMPYRCSPAACSLSGPPEWRHGPAPRSRPRPAPGPRAAGSGRPTWHLAAARAEVTGALKMGIQTPRGPWRPGPGADAGGAPRHRGTNACICIGQGLGAGPARLLMHAPYRKAGALRATPWPRPHHARCASGLAAPAAPGIPCSQRTSPEAIIRSQFQGE